MLVTFFSWNYRLGHHSRSPLIYIRYLQFFTFHVFTNSFSRYWHLFDILPLFNSHENVSKFPKVSDTILTIFINLWINSQKKRDGYSLSHGYSSRGRAQGSSIYMIDLLWNVHSLSVKSELFPLFVFNSCRGCPLVDCFHYTGCKTVEISIILLGVEHILSRGRAMLDPWSSRGRALLDP